MSRPRVLLQARDLKSHVDLRHRVNNLIIGPRRRVLRKATCVVQLGCYGDLLNVLPLLELLNREEPQKPSLLCLQNFADLGNLVDYAYFDVFPGTSTEQLRTAVGYAESHYKRVLVTQCWRNPKDTPELAAVCLHGYCEREYMLAGYHDAFLRGEFSDINLNKRDLKAEEEFYKQTLGPLVGKRFVLVNALGISSPLSQEESELLFQTVRDEAHSHGFHVFDMRHIRAPSFGLLLGLFDRADLLVTIDTGTLHLAGAHKKVPYIALVQDRWSFAASITRGNCLARIGYTRLANRENLDAIRRAIRDIPV